MVGLSAIDGMVPEWGGVLENWADYCCVKMEYCWCGKTPALFSCFRKYSLLLALDIMVLMWVVQDKLASR